MLRRLLSFFLPVTIHQQKSSISKKIEVTWNNGELVLDSQNTNYSYGSLQRILRRGLKHVGYERVAKIKQILVLGVAGGSVIKTLIDEIGCKGTITGVEIDPEIIQVANTYFHLDKIPNLNLVIDDAFEFVLKTREKYGLIIVDVFQDALMPNFLFEKFFAHRLAFLLDDKGVVLFNTMTLNGIHDARNEEYISHFPATEFSVKTIPRVERHNELIVVEKIG